MSLTTLLFVTFFFFSAFPAQAAAVTYTGAEGRDPFSSLLEQKKMIEDPNLEEKKLRSLVVQGLVASAANPRAIINGKIYRVGNDLLPGIKVTRIQKEGVFVMIGEKETLLSRAIQPTKGKTAQ